MIFIKYSTSIFLLIFLFACNNNSEEKHIQQTFQTYKSSVINDDGKAAIEVIDKRTINHYKRILELVISADSSAIETLPTMDKFFVLAIRHIIPADSIQLMTGDGLFIYAINKGMIGKEGAMKIDIGNIAIEDNFAMAEFTSEGKMTGIKINFYKDEGNWKFDLSSFFKVGNIAFKNLLKDCPSSENECIAEILETTYGKTGRNMWKPIK